MIAIAIMPSHDIILTHFFLTEKPGTQFISIVRGNLPETEIRKNFFNLGLQSKNKIVVSNY